MKHKISLSINNRRYEVEADVRDTLLDVLRDRLGLTGTKRGCDAGECGACTVLVDGKPCNACLLLAIDIPGCAIVTIEGVAQDRLHPIQRAFIENGAVQCGFCAPGIILTTKAFLDQPGPPTRARARRAISGNLCRCTGYQKIIDAIQDAASRLQEEAPCPNTGS